MSSYNNNNIIVIIKLYKENAANLKITGHLIMLYSLNYSFGFVFFSELFFYGIRSLTSCPILLTYPSIGPAVTLEVLQAELIMLYENMNLSFYTHSFINSFIHSL